MYQNRVHLIGYLGKNPEHKSVKATDRKYAVLSLATQRSWKGADEEWLRAPKDVDVRRRRRQTSDLGRCQAAGCSGGSSRSGNALAGL